MQILFTPLISKVIESLNDTVEIFTFFIENNYKYE